MKKCAVYIGDFDFRNENVQAHLVKNNGKILNGLGYTVAYIGINRDVQSFKGLTELTSVDIGENHYLELPYTLNVSGLRYYREVSETIISYLNELVQSYEVDFVISYQAPTFATVLRSVIMWCRAHQAAYIVNCADLPVFDSQPLLRRLVMKWNWRQMHRINQRFADGVIAVSRYIQRFYHKDGRPSVVVPPLFDELSKKTEMLPDETPTFLYAGTPFALQGRPVKSVGMKDRLDRIIDLFAVLSERGIRYTFTVVGVTKEAYTTCIPRHKNVVENANIVFLGRLPHSETLAKLMSSDFMINYRDKNVMTEAGLSTKVVESVSVGTPVIMNDVGETFEYLRDGLSGFLLCGEVEKDVSLLTYLCDTTVAERIAIKEACRGDQLFSPMRYQEVIRTFLESILQK